MLYSSPFITAYVLAVAGIFGLVMGSFINCWAWRSTHGESVVKGRSHCATCGHELSARDLVPIFSWLATRGTCRYCGEKVSARYPATELITCASFVAITAVYGLTLETVELLAFASILLFASLTDFDERIIPNGCILAAIAVRALYLAAMEALGVDMSQAALDSLIGFAALGLGILVISLVADFIFKRESMGGGDIKLYAVAGLYFGWQQGLLLVFLSCVVGLAFGLARRERVIPFGPSIAISCIIVMLVGTPLVDWYASLF